MAAGGGKSYALLLDALKYIDCPNFYAVYFRRTTQQLERSLWPEAKEMYMPFLTDENGKFVGKAKIREKDHKIVFPSGAMLEFSYMEHDKDAQLNWQGAQVTGVYWDEFTQFSEYQFNYLRTRLRSKSKYPSFVRASMNPDSEHFVVNWIEAWLLDSGIPDRSLSGKMRYFLFDGGQLFTSWDKKSLEQQHPGKKARTYTFVPSILSDNPAMLSKNPDYEEELSANSRLERETLLEGNWRVKLSETTFWDRSWVKNKATPLNVKTCRAYDKADGEPSETTSPDYTASIKMSKDKDGYYYIQGDFHPEFKDVGSDILGMFRKRSGERNILINKQAEWDGTECAVVLARDPAAAGKTEFNLSARELVGNGFEVREDPMPYNKSKIVKFSPFAAACENGLVYIDVESFPNKATLENFYKQLEKFTGERSTRTYKDDVADTCASAFNFLAKQIVILPLKLPQIQHSKKKEMLNK